MVLDGLKNREVEVKVRCFRELSNLGFALALDNYQRPYVWSERKIRELLTDLADYAASRHEGGDTPAYYMGTLLLHWDEVEAKLFVIDGQQRLSSLCLLHLSLEGKLPAHFDFHYRSPISAKNLRNAYKLITLEAERLPANLFDHLCFTTITVNSQDLAFTFFDTQNNRGVPLKATDLLKAFHLRAMQCEDKIREETFQKLCAKRWESVQVNGERDRRSKGNDFAPELFHTYLWRARNWRGQRFTERDNHDLLLESFQQQSIPAATLDDVPLYPGVANRFADSLTLLDNDEFRLGLQPVMVTRSAVNLPFSLRQPIHQGLGFFLYGQKYAAMLDRLFHDENPSTEIERVRALYSQVVSHQSPYLRELYCLALLLFMDRLGEVRLYEFALWLEHVLGAIRLQKAYVFREAPVKYLKESTNNLLDVIADAYRSEEVIEFLKADGTAGQVYKKGIPEGVKIGEGVRGRYLKALLRFYDNYAIEDKAAWIKRKLDEQQPVGVTVNG